MLSPPPSFTGPIPRTPLTTPPASLPLLPMSSPLECPTSPPTTTPTDMSPKLSNSLLWLELTLQLAALVDSSLDSRVCDLTVGLAPNAQVYATSFGNEWHACHPRQSVSLCLNLFRRVLTCYCLSVIINVGEVHTHRSFMCRRNPKRSGVACPGLCNLRLIVSAINESGIKQYSMASLTPHAALRCAAMWCDAPRCGVLRCERVAAHCAALWDAALCATLRCGALWRAALRSTAQRCA